MVVGDQKSSMWVHLMVVGDLVVVDRVGWAVVDHLEDPVDMVLAWLR